MLSVWHILSTTQSRSTYSATVLESEHVNLGSFSGKANLGIIRSRSKFSSNRYILSLWCARLHPCSFTVWQETMHVDTQSNRTSTRSHGAWIPGVIKHIRWDPMHAIQIYDATSKSRISCVWGQNYSTDPSGCLYFTLGYNMKLLQGLYLLTE